MSGFTLAFGSMFSKTWRVHTIFTNIQLNKKVSFYDDVDDYHYFYNGVGCLEEIFISSTTSGQEGGRGGERRGRNVEKRKIKKKKGGEPIIVYCIVFNHTLGD